MYITTGEVTKRGAAVSLMILIAFKDSSPLSEKILRLYKHIYDCFPSEQYHHSYSIMSIANNTFSLLSREDSPLFDHIQRAYQKFIDDNIAESTEMQSGKVLPYQFIDIVPY